MAVKPIEKALENLSHVLKILHTYPKEMEQIGFHDLVKPDAVCKLPRESNCSKLEKLA